MLVKVRVAGVNFVDIYQRQGHYGVALPYIPGLEAAGCCSCSGAAISVSGGHLNGFVATRVELLRRAGDVLAGMRDGWLRPHIGHVLPLAEAAQAHRMLEERRSAGKLLLAVAD